MSGGTLDFVARPGRALSGTLRVPGDKSISHRAIMLGSLAQGRTEITGFLEGEDTRATAAAFGALGVRIEAPAPSRRVVHGVGLDGLRAPQAEIDCGNAGTGMRLLAGVLAGQRFDATLTGDASLSRRPMRRVIEPLTRMGARIDARDGQFAPLRIHGGRALRAIDYESPVASAQVKSCVLLAGLYAEGTTTVREPHPTRDHSERMLAAFGAALVRDGDRIGVRGGSVLAGTAVAVPGDFSSAAFFLVAASLIPGSSLRIEGVGMNPLRTGLLRALRDMGARVDEVDGRLEAGEPVAGLEAAFAPLTGIEVPRSVVPDMIDEFPVLFVAAALARGRTIVRGAAELRVKESDRIAVMARGLRTLGARIEETEDGAVIDGVDSLEGGVVDSAGDHRCAMAFAVAAQRAKAPVRIRDCANVATSFPGFDALARAAGMDVLVQS